VSFNVLSCSGPSDMFNNTPGLGCGYLLYFVLNAG
jgi:hypothetical protein